MQKRSIIGGIVVLALAAAYTGYWFWLAQTFERNLAFWIEQQRAMGYRISYSASEPSGFPLPVRLRLADVVVEAPFGHPQWRFDSAFMRLKIAPWSPLTLNIDSEHTRPGYQFKWAVPSRNGDLSVGGGLSLAIRLPIEGERLGVEIRRGGVTISASARDLAWIGDLAGSIEFSEARSHTDTSVTFDLSAETINFPMPAPVKTVETYSWGLSGKIMGQLPSEPLPRALAAWSSEGGYLELTEFRANWEAHTDLRIEGSAALDPQLQPVASMTTHLRNYAGLIDWLVSIGALTTTQATAAKFALAAKSKPIADGSRELEAQVPLTIQNGYLSVGATKIARVPTIAWH